MMALISVSSRYHRKTTRRILHKLQVSDEQARLSRSNWLRRRRRPRGRNRSFLCCENGWVWPTRRTSY